MPLKLMYITNKPEIAKIAEETGVDWIFIDMEFIGKDLRQGGLDTVQNRHTIQDIKDVSQVVEKAKILVRINPIHEQFDGYSSSKDEIDSVIEAGAHIIMLPFFKTQEEVKTFLSLVDGRAKTMLLLETVEAARNIDAILDIPGIDMIYIGLNDLHLQLSQKFMFELLADGTVEDLGHKIKSKDIPFGFGGLAVLDGGALPGSMVLKEHIRLGSSMVILSRSFCNTNVITDLDEVKNTFDRGILAIRDLEREALNANLAYFEDNRKKVIASINQIAGTNYII